ncbi:MAG: hypothetical protein B6D56_04105 [Candidatus Omnitrophica bacterium 4484_70.1]|nr:MAG: hypothetical protein B6D56_04105 [Candidatus Omnitrophica bacterium 4484_70.1]
MTEVLSLNDIELFIKFVLKERGLDLTPYSKKFLGRRIFSRLLSLRLNSIRGYVDFLKKNPQEFTNFLNALSINVSEFFRDPEVFDYFYKHCLSKLIEEKIKRKENWIHCWSCGCSYGEETYSLAILIREILEKGNNLKVKIWGTDINKEALRTAQEGEYKMKSLKKIDRRFLDKYFIYLPHKNMYRVKEEIKKIVIFKRHNLLLDKPFCSMDVIFFRNVKIYFDREKGDHFLSVICNSLKNGGYLVLGKVEMLPHSLSELFEVVSIKYRIFRKFLGRRLE